MLKDDTCNFETAAEILKTLNFTIDKDFSEKVDALFAEWENVVGKKLARYSKPKKLTEDGILIVSCKNSVVGNELFNSRIKINSILKKKAKENQIDFFKFIKITYG